LKRGLDDISSADFNKLSSSSSSSAVNNKKARSSEITNVTSNVVWTLKMDELLKDAVMKYQEDWIVISEVVRTQLNMLSLDTSSSGSAAQIPVVNPPLPAHPDPIECMERWSHLQFEKFPTWTEYEVSRQQTTTTVSVYNYSLNNNLCGDILSLSLCNRSTPCNDW